jgi:hypothetical protein
MAQPEIHSVILNLNKNFSNNTGANFTQIVNKELEIKPNSLVALYTGNLVRKPIVLETDTKITINITSSFPNATQEGYGFRAEIRVTPFTSVTATIPKGEYSKLAFCRTFCDKINEQIGASLVRVTTPVLPDGLVALEQTFPYEMFYEMKNDNFFLGLRYFLAEEVIANETSFFQMELKELNNGQLNASNVVASYSTQQQFIINSNDDTLTDWSPHCFGNQAVRGMAMSTYDEPNTLSTDVGFIKAKFSGTAPNKTQEFCFNLHNTFFTADWATTGGVGSGSNVPNTMTIQGTGIVVPVTTIGAYFSATGDGTNYTAEKVYIHCNDKLHELNQEQYNSQANYDDFLATEGKLLKEIDLNDYVISLIDKPQFSWEIYCVVAPQGRYSNQKVEENRQYYFRFVGHSVYGDKANRAVLYDSKNDNIRMSHEAVETGYMFQQLVNVEDPTFQTTGGLCPQFYFKNTAADLQVINPTGNFSVMRTDNDSKFELMNGCNGYSFEVPSAGNENTTSLKNILGVASNKTRATNLNVNTTFNPNFYPKISELAGLSQLGSDRLRYNVEVNLPVRAYNTTESTTNDLGQVRNIVHNSNPVVEDTTNLSSGLVNKNLEPNTIKYLSLNNREAIKLNSLDVKIRRAKTNEIADEIEDASVELLFKSQ